MISPIMCFGQIYFDKNNYDNTIDYTSQTINYQYKDYLIKGNFSKIEVNYSDYLVVQGLNDIHSVIKPMSKMGFTQIIVVKGDYTTMLKEFKKGKGFKKTQLLLSEYPSMSEVRLIDESTKNKQLEAEKKKKEDNDQFASQLAKSEIIGVYKIQILRHNNLDYSSLDTFGKIIITEIGVTIETEIVTLDLLRGSYNKSYSNPSEKELTCDVTKGYADMFTVSFNKEMTVGGMTKIKGRNSITTTFKIVID